MSSKTIMICIFIVLTTLSICRSIDVDGLLKNKQYVEKQVNCILGRTYCDPMGYQIKALVSEAFYNSCNRCTEDQKEKAQRIVEYIQANYPEDFQLVLQHYFPDSMGHL